MWGAESEWGNEQDNTTNWKKLLNIFNN